MINTSRKIILATYLDIIEALQKRDYNKPAETPEDDARRLFSIARNYGQELADVEAVKNGVENAMDVEQIKHEAQELSERIAAEADTIRRWLDDNCGTVSELSPAQQAALQYGDAVDLDEWQNDWKNTYNDLRQF